MKNKSPSKILFKLGCVLAGIGIAAFVASSFLLMFTKDGGNMIEAALNAFITGVTSLFGAGQRGSTITYACIGIGAVTVLVTIYFASIFGKTKRGTGIAAAILSCIDMVVVVFLLEAVFIASRSGSPIRIRAYGGLLITAVPIALSLMSLIICQIVSFADVAGQSKDDIENLQKQIDELKAQIANIKTAPVAKVAPAPVAKAEPVVAPVEEPVEEVVEDKDVETVIDEATGITYIVRYNKSFEAKITLAKSDVQDWYNEVKNYILSYGANSRVSWNYDAFNIGRNTVAKLNITGKTLSIYLDLDPAAYVDSKYHAKDVSSSKKYAQTPTQMKIKSVRGVKFAKELVDELMKKYEKTSDGSVAGDFHPVAKTFKKLMAEGLIKQSRSLAKVGDVAVAAPVAAPVEQPAEEVVADKDVETVVDETTGITYIVRYNKSYEAKIALASDDVQDWYNEVKNYILSFGANSRVSWNYDAFNIGRNTVAKLNITGKTLSIYLDLDPAAYVDSKYHAKDVSSSKKYAQTPTQMKIKSVRGVKFAKELVDELMKKYEKTSDGSVAGDFHVKGQTFKKLMNAGLIKQSRSLAKPVDSAK